MAERLVNKSGKNEDGDITSLCNSTEGWSPRLKADAIADLDGEIHTYVVDVGGKRVDIKVIGEGAAAYLRTDPDKTTTNNLDDLPDC